MTFSIHHQVPDFSVSVHCISLFLLKAVILLIVSVFLTKRGKQIIRVNLGRGVGARKTLENVSNWLFSWIAVRVICPGIILRLGRWLCCVANSILPEVLDIFNKASRSHSFWLLYGWLEILLFATLFAFLFRFGMGTSFKDIYIRIQQLFGRPTRRRKTFPRLIETDIEDTSEDEEIEVSSPHLSRPRKRLRFATNTNRPSSGFRSRSLATGRTQTSRRRSSTASGTSHSPVRKRSRSSGVRRTGRGSSNSNRVSAGTEGGREIKDVDSSTSTSSSEVEIGNSVNKYRLNPSIL